MTDDNSKTSSEENLVDIDDLDAFEKEFFQTEESEEKEKEKVVENENDQLATDDDKDASEDEKPTEDEDEDEVEEEAPKPEPKPKSKAQKRIEALNTQVRETERQNADLLRRLEALEAKKEVANKDADVPALRDRLPADAPNPDASDKDGNPIYPLGEFDPMFIRDITKYSVNKELAEDRARTAQEAETAKMVQAQKEIQEGWIDRLDTYEEEVPEIREDIEDLVYTFQSLDPAYGEYLAAVIMANEHGPAIMHYLSQNIGEAQKIVASGPAAATLALGRIEASLTVPKPEEKRNIKKQSDAPAPPESRSRGSGGKFAVPPDTDDLDAFERIFFKKK